MADDAPQFVFPTRRDDDADDGPEDHLALLCSVDLAEAAGFCARLEAEGIVCGARASSVSDGIEAGVHYANIFVREEDLDMAREVLARPPEQDEVDEDDPAEVEDRYIANWICPHCKKRRLDLLPPTRRVMHLRMALAAVVGVPLLIGLVEWLVPQWQGSIPWSDGMGTCWILLVLGLGWMSILPERLKTCKGCGWRSGDSSRD